MSYANLNELFPTGVLESFSFPNSKLHKAYSNVNRSLLTDDIKNIRVVVNSYVILGSSPGIRPRAEIEMPKLVSRAQELIGLLKQEYPA